MIELRDLKKEAASLDDISSAVEKLQQHWIKPFHKHNNSHLPFLKTLPLPVRAALSKKLIPAHAQLEEVKTGQHINEKLQQFSRNLLQLKLSTVQGDHKKAQYLVKQMVSDEYSNVSQAIEDIKNFEITVRKLSDHYHDVNELLHQNLSLEETVFFMELPHYYYLQSLLKTTQKQRILIRDLGRHLVALTKEASLKNVPHK